MKRIDTATKYTDKFGPGKHGWRNGDKANAIVATQFNAEMMDNIQEEIANVIEAAGIVLNGGDMTQLKQAIAQMIVNGGPVKAAVRVASTAAINLAAPGANIDGVAMVAGDRFLEKDHGTGSSRGIYIWNGAAVPATRSGDADGAGEIVAGMLVVVQEGTANADTIWELTTDGVITIGATALTFTLAGSSKFVKKEGDTLLGALALFGGDTGVTPAQFDNSTKVANTEFVQRALGAYRGSSLVISGTTTLSGSTVAGKYVQLSGAGQYTVTLPNVSEMPGGSGFGVVCTGSGTFTIQRQGTDNIYHALSTPVTSFTMTSGDIVWIMSDGGVWDIVSGSKLLRYLPQFGSSLASNGYQKLPSGLIIQWGTINTSASADVAVTLPIAFPNAGLIVFSSQYGAGSGAFSNTNSLTVSNFNIAAWSATTTRVAVSVFWLVIGY